MKTKSVSKSRKAEREYDVALLECKNEYGVIICEDILEEIFMEEEDDE